MADGDPLQPAHLDWTLPEGRIHSIRGWGGRLFAIVQHHGKATLCFHDGEVRRFDSLAALLDDLDEGQRRAVGLDPEAARGAQALREAAHHLQRGRRDDAVARATRVLDSLEIEAPQPEVYARPADREAFAAQAFERAADFLEHGSHSTCALQISEALDALRASPVDPQDVTLNGFFWPLQPEDVETAVETARALPVLRSADLPPFGGWRVLPLGEGFGHPAGVDVGHVPVPPTDRLAEDGRLWVAFRRLTNRARRFIKLLELDAPETILKEERRHMADGLSALIETATGPSAPPTRLPFFSSAPRSPLRLTTPPSAPGSWVFRVPYTHAPERFVVGLDHALLVCTTDAVQHRLEPCAWRPLFGTARHLAFCGRFRSAEPDPEVAVLDVLDGVWLTSWPDGPGVENLHDCWLPETDGHGAHWLMDPRYGRSHVVPGPVLAHCAELGRWVVCRTAEGVAAASPGPGEVRAFSMDVGPWSTRFRIDVGTGDVRKAEASGVRPPANREVVAVSHAHHGQVIVATTEALYVDGTQLATFPGVLDVAVEGGNGSGNGFLALLTPNAVLSFEFDNETEDREASLQLRTRIPLPQAQT